MAGPTFPELRGGEEVVRQFFHGGLDVCLSGFFKGVLLLGGGGQASYGEGEAAEDGEGVGFSVWG